MQLQNAVVAQCYMGKQLQIARRLITVGGRWRSIANGVAVFLGKQLQMARCLIMVG